MRGVFFENANVPLLLKSLPDPEPGEGELVLKVHRCGICGSDVHLTKEHGFYPENTVIGHEFAGEVVAVGKGVAGFRTGDRITALPVAGCGRCGPCFAGTPLFCQNGVTGYAGGFADYMRVAAATALQLPQSISMEDGALVEPLSVSLHGVALARMEPGAKVLVLGAGSIGLAAIHWARKLGAGRIVAMSRSARRAEMAGKMGADAFVCAGENEYAEVQAALGGAPDVVFECIGAVGALQQCINHVRVNGTVVSLGFCTKPDGVIPAITTFKQITLVFSMAYSVAEFRFALDAFDRGHVEPRQMVSSVIALDDVPDTIERMRAGYASEIKVQARPEL